MAIEQLQVRNKAILLAKQVYTMTKTNHQLSKDYGLKDQIQRAAVSIASNIAEGYDRETQKEFLRYLFIARASTSELKTQIIICKEVGLVDDDYDPMMKCIIEVHKMLNSLIATVTKKTI